MTWIPIDQAPRDGTWLDLGHAEIDHVARGRWGLHRQSGVYRWVDGDGVGLVATHFAYPRVPPKYKYDAGIGGNPNDPWHIEHDDNGEPYTRYEKPDLLPLHMQGLRRAGESAAEHRARLNKPIEPAEKNIGRKQRDQ